MTQHCPFCFSPRYTSSYLPDTFFNAKAFRYITCKECRLIYVNPLPSDVDYLAMYPPTYQNGVDQEIILEGEKLPGLRFPYSKHFELIRKYAPGKNILDYGCGQASFVVNAKNYGFECDGVEYNPLHIDVLKASIQGSNFYEINHFLKNQSEKYDVIRLSNVLEHLENPNNIIQLLTSKLTTHGILLIEGPIETNPSFALFIRKFYFKMSRLLFKNKKANHPPTHIFFSNSDNQRNFFRKNALTELHFEITECEWPFPENLTEIRSPGTFLKYIIAKTSILSRILNKNWGNTFIYIGKKT
jgi:SAM-dependent methyltransferase